MSELPTEEEAQARSAVCRQIAEHMDTYADLAAQLGMDSWQRHFQRDAEYLRMRAEREFGEDYLNHAHDPPELST